MKENKPPMKAPELLLPAGSLDKMRAAYDFGADAVYAGQPRYSLRARNNEFRMEQIAQGIQEAHQRGKKFFLTSNVIAHNDKIRTYLRDIEPIIDLKPDALIMADPGLIMMVKEKWPEAVIHLSVQANTTNYATVKFWQKMGVERIILSRELSLDEIEKIRQECPDMELEVFVHGALCIAYSGRCLLSGYFNRRDPNQGTCTNACRWEYKTHGADVDPNTGEALGQAMEQGFNFEDAKNDADNQFTSTCGDQKRHPKADAIYLLEEKGRPGEMMPIMEDEHGTYIMNSKDLRAVEHVERLTKIGVDSLKIEGRTKSLYYVARTAQTYRRAIDDAVAGRPFNPHLITELEGLANRGYTGGLLERRPANDYQNYETGTSVLQRSHFVGQVRGYENGLAEIETMNRFAVGDMIEIIHPTGNRTMKLEQMFNLDGEPVQVAPGNPVRVRIPVEGPIEGGLISRLLHPEQA
ncbi:tRNA 5-hydroxyuridine modification protein YegQ [Comamonas aquatica]|uniref:tRNA 5-hydroxyuridine modification protein YegQ n=2 Tax=Comamonadaceae TaxID=80864 RepID=A0AA42W0L8_9BURK|nr:tRNA 5-hydroxyuridine modification protein YegQ [Comamonas aquatica]MDE1555741.1 tRNA 5-hydroxyuridine modification protein YegQ [Comamonas aquatica]MDH1427863.1 tRNA 5-hydroxyuridine modification protein YegQ [Comamonas aquatica]MDH1605850.1 tRNA 5-hydroxyuridine modification protein YegQ [Comamonas aquatica]MDH1616462.1 tRNA 5-hydroxyuridine modification protein YegQ [Comamonas aquatica]MDH1765262.1 tRNA 5-hydroxyuridine modification protein YegQ [Comamonas aquatica]